MLGGQMSEVDGLLGSVPARGSEGPHGDEPRDRERRWRRVVPVHTGHRDAASTGGVASMAELQTVDRRSFLKLSGLATGIVLSGGAVIVGTVGQRPLGVAAAQTGREGSVRLP